MEAKSKRSALVLHINEELDRSNQQDLISALSNSQGINDARSPASNAHLLVVDYDPSSINHSEIMNRARRQSIAVQRVG